MNDVFYSQLKQTRKVMSFVSTYKQLTVVMSGCLSIDTAMSFIVRSCVWLLVRVCHYVTTWNWARCLHPAFVRVTKSYNLVVDKVWRCCESGKATSGSSCRFNCRPVSLQANTKDWHLWRIQRGAVGAVAPLLAHICFMKSLFSMQRHIFRCAHLW